MVIVGARKPDFFTSAGAVLRGGDGGGPAAAAGWRRSRSGGAYLGGSAARLERDLGLSGDEILYVGDHMFGDVHVTKRVLRWRTALILRELEDEVAAIEAFAATERRLAALMREKEALEARRSTRLAPRPAAARGGYGPPRRRDGGDAGGARRTTLRAQLIALDAEIAPLARAAGELSQPALGPAHARRQRQEPPRAPDRALRRHLHVARLQLPARHAVRLPALAARAACRTIRSPLGPAGRRPRTRVLESEFAFAVCQLGAEGALKEEVAAAHPTLRFAYSRPGLVTWRSSAPLPPSFALGAVFARAWGISLGPLGALPAAPRLHVFERDVARPGEEPPGHVPGARAAAVEARLRAEASFRDGRRARPGELVLDVIVAPEGDEPPWLGAHVHGGERSPWPGGAWPVEVPPAAPSRAYRKLEEALAWSRAPLRRGDVAVEIGSAPGGASYALLRRGLEVIGVDPGEMAPAVLGFEGRSGNRFRHLPISVGALRREALPARVHWLLLDVNLAPQVALHNVRRLVAALRRGLRGVLFTLKLNDWRMAREVPDLLARISAMGLVGVRATQLPSNRQEIFVYAETIASRRR